MWSFGGGINDINQPIDNVYNGDNNREKETN